MDKTSPSTGNISLLNTLMDLYAQREKVIASNVANAETPGYAPARFAFQEQLNTALNNGAFTLATTQPGHIPVTPQSIENVTGRITRKQDTTGIGDLNGVSLEEEMLALSENELRYETAAQLIKKKLTIKKYLISGGQ